MLGRCTPLTGTCEALQSKILVSYTVSDDSFLSIRLLPFSASLLLPSPFPLEKPDTQAMTKATQHQIPPH